MVKRFLTSKNNAIPIFIALFLVAISTFAIVSVGPKAFFCGSGWIAALPLVISMALGNS